MKNRGKSNFRYRLEATNLATDKPSPKLTSKHHSPFLIKEKLSDLTYHLELPPHWKIHNIFHVNVLSEAKPDMIPKHTNPPPPPIKINGEEYWVIDKYINAQWFCNWFQFKIWWEGFLKEHDTWENADDINSDEGPHLLQEDNDDFDLEEDFYKRHPDVPQQTDPLNMHTWPTRKHRICK